MSSPSDSGISLDEASSSYGAWTQSVLSASDFRSDITTSASKHQLKAIGNAGINDGWTASGARPLEENMAKLAGRQAALFMVSSTMGNQTCIRTHLNRPPNGIICDARSHLIHQETGSIGWLSGAMPITVIPRNGLYLTVEDIERKIVLSDGRDCCTCPTRLIHLENPLGGVMMPLKELQRIHAYAKRNDLVVHMDGARLWEGVAAGFGTLREYCNAVDSVNLCLTKGIGASVGSVVLGDVEYIKHVKWVRKSVGGGMRQPGWVAAAAWAAIEETFGTDPSGAHAVHLRNSHEWAARLANTWRGLGGRLVIPQQTNMLWLDLDWQGIDEAEWEQVANDEYGLAVHSSRIVTHYQTTEEAVTRLEAFMAVMVQRTESRPAIVDAVPRNEAVSRLAAAMREAAELAAARS